MIFKYILKKGEKELVNLGLPMFTPNSLFETPTQKDALKIQHFISILITYIFYAHCF